MITYQQAVVDGSRIFYREAGPKDRPTILLLQETVPDPQTIGPHA